MNPILERLQSDIAGSVNDLSAGQTQLRPVGGPDKWTIQQIVQHLCLSYASTETAVRNRLDKGRPTQSVPTVPQRCLQCLITDLGCFPPGREAPAVVVPPKAPGSSEDQISGDALRNEAALRLADMDKRLDEAESAFGKRRVVSHAILGPLSIAQWRRFHRTHGLHHVKQIWAIRRQHGV
ncbi:MAG TPA: DinB family protein [Edaphobacter sp.]